ncbi:PAS domain-containing sensor histidine kinase [Massilia forsythiae]|uniref:histidine kinase n=1 Tax=Massilia forsythiae TaxID=2728020 RepID=A0A7Z2ZUL2_9BURK|nr:PAS domain-containing sensor histidine kinase [Massilia forsythiae]QJE02529.1 PAS domain-containing sensor histidine kinase [Massilia forsythiae]
METNNRSLRREFARLDNGWPESYAWAIEQMPCPAYCCSHDGAVIHRNASAKRIWGETQHSAQTSRWDGFAALRDLDGQPLDKDDSPAALAAAGDSPVPTELLALCQDGQLRRVVIHAKPVFDEQGAIMGALCCLTDVSEKRRLQERALGAANARDDFLGMLAHELRNPLAPIMSIAGALQLSNADPKIAKMATIVQRQTKQLARFITDLLDASRVDCFCDLQVEIRVCTEDDILALALDAVEPEVRARKQRLVVEVNDRDASLRCDPERVAQALGNVLRNASAFTPDGEEICLRVFVEGDVLRVEVVDCGAGIAAEDLPHVFEPFERRAVAPGRAPEGAGLGLTIAKGVCEAHGGSIDVRSAGLGLGTTVSLALPVAVGAV